MEKGINGIKVAFVVPPVSAGTMYDDWDLSEVDSVSPPMGLLWLAGVVRKNGGLATIHDAYARRMSPDAVIDEVTAASPDAIGVSAMSYSYPGAKLLIQRLKARLPQIPVILGGVHITAVPVDVMEDLPELDFGVLREGEATLVELLDAIIHGSDPAGIDGIIFRKGRDTVRTTERKFLQDLDALPMPAWDMLPSFPDSYKLSTIGTRGAKSASLITSRGCFGKCRFCDVGAMGKTVRAFSAGYVLGMIEHLMTRYGIKDFLIYDDNFVTFKPRVRKICESIIDKGWNIQWSCSARIDMVDPDLLVLMRKAGCWQIEYGIESGSQAMLDSMQKNITLDAIRQALRWTRKAGIQTRGNFIFGYPGETRETIEESIKFACNTDLDYFQQTFLTPYPGSAICSEIDAYGRFDRDPAKMNNLAINFVPQGMSEAELLLLSRQAFRRFYLRPGIIWTHLRHISTLDDILRLKSAVIAFIVTVFKKRKSVKAKQ